MEYTNLPFKLCAEKLISTGRYAQTFTSNINNNIPRNNYYSVTIFMQISVCINFHLM